MKEISIKNMVCPRCIEAVRKTFQEMEIETQEIKLGSVKVAKTISPSVKKQLQNALQDQGFELLDDHQTKLITAIKSILIEEIHYSKEARTLNYSTLLSKKLNYEYSHLSRLFSIVEGKTIEKFIMMQKIEKVKEYIAYDEMTLSEIAFEMGYSSPAHLSAQFKKITGMTPSQFKKLRGNTRESIDKI